PNDSLAFYIGGLPYNVYYSASGANAHYHGAGSITYVGSHNIASFGMLPPTPYTGQALLYFHRGNGRCLESVTQIYQTPQKICYTKIEQQLTVKGLHPTVVIDKTLVV
ncbi:MAG: hypothetical protein JKY70_05095, partial [Mucilaginibacter sp.]|nr:hypothetical protein [Mucilaginibacter sp.]